MLIIQKKDDSEGIRRQRAEPRAMENNSQRVELSPTHRTGNICLAGIQNFYGLMTLPSPFNGSFYCRQSKLVWLDDKYVNGRSPVSSVHRTSAKRTGTLVLCFRHLALGDSTAPGLIKWWTSSLRLVLNGMKLLKNIGERWIHFAYGKNVNCWARGRLYFIERATCSSRILPLPQHEVESNISPTECRWISD